MASVEDMYGRADTKPRPPTYDADDLRAMRAAEERLALEARADVTGAHAAPSTEQPQRRACACVCLTRTRANVLVPERLWAAVQVPENIGLECERYKWRQNQARTAPTHPGRQAGVNARRSPVNPRDDACPADMLL